MAESLLAAESSPPAPQAEACDHPGKRGAAAAGSPLAQPWALKGLAGYFAVLAACHLILVWSLKLWRAHLSIPLASSGDAVFHLVMIRLFLKSSG